MEGLVFFPQILGGTVRLVCPGLALPWSAGLGVKSWGLIPKLWPPSHSASQIQLMSPAAPWPLPSSLLCSDGVYGGLSPKYHPISIPLLRSPPKVPKF